jgi:hypothetical protein
MEETNFTGSNYMLSMVSQASLPVRYLSLAHRHRIDTGVKFIETEINHRPFKGRLTVFSHQINSGLLGIRLKTVGELLRQLWFRCIFGALFKPQNEDSDVPLLQVRLFYFQFFDPGRVSPGYDKQAALPLKIRNFGFARHHGGNHKQQ